MRCLVLLAARRQPGQCRRTCLSAKQKSSSGRQDRAGPPASRRAGAPRCRSKMTRRTLHNYTCSTAPPSRVAAPVPLRRLCYPSGGNQTPPWYGRRCSHCADLRRWPTSRQAREAGRDGGCLHSRAAARTAREPARPHAFTPTFARGGAGAKAQRLAQHVDRARALVLRDAACRRVWRPAVARLGLAHGVPRTRARSALRGSRVKAAASGAAAAQHSPAGAIPCAVLGTAPPGDARQSIMQTARNWEHDCSLSRSWKKQKNLFGRLGPK